MAKGVVTTLSFIIFGSVPLLIFVLKGHFTSFFGISLQHPLTISTLASALTMFLLGALSGTFTEQNVLKSGLIMAVNGLLAAYAAYAIGCVMESINVGEAVITGAGAASHEL